MSALGKHWRWSRGLQAGVAEDGQRCRIRRRPSPRKVESIRQRPRKVEFEPLLSPCSMPPPKRCPSSPPTTSGTPIAGRSAPLSDRDRRPSRRGPFPTLKGLPSSAVGSILGARKTRRSLGDYLEELAK